MNNLNEQISRIRKVMGLNEAVGDDEWQKEWDRKYDERQAEYQRQYDLEIRAEEEKKASDLADLRTRTINGLHIVEMYWDDDGNRGFSMEDGTLFLIDKYNYLEHIDPEEYNTFARQDASSEYGYNDARDEYLNNGKKPVFDSKFDMKTFMTLMKKFDNFHPDNRVKEKFIFTPDVKIVKAKEIDGDYFQKYVGKIVKLEKYLTFGDVVEFKVTDVNYKADYLFNSLWITLTYDEGHSLFNRNLNIHFMVNHDNGIFKKLDIEYMFSVGFNREESKKLDVKKITDQDLYNLVTGIVKELK